MLREAGALGAPRFDVVLRGYDRKQVDEYVVRLQRAVARMGADLAMARSHPLPLVSPLGGMPVGGGPRAVARHQHPGGPQQHGREAPDLVGSFTDRMQSILQAAEEEATEIRNKARAAARAEEEKVRAQLADLVRQRDALLGELARARGQLKGMLPTPAGRIDLTRSDSEPARPGPSQPSPNAEQPSLGEPQPSQLSPQRPSHQAQEPSPRNQPAGAPTPKPQPSAGTRSSDSDPQPAQPSSQPAQAPFEARPQVSPTPRPRPSSEGQEQAPARPAADATKGAGVGRPVSDDSVTRAAPQVPPVIGAGPPTSDRPAT